MATLQYNEITPRTYIDLNGEPWEVISSQVSRKQANKPVNKTKIKSLLSGKVIEKVFHSSDRAEEADIEKIDTKYLYSNRGEYWFCDPNNPRERYHLDASVLGNAIQFVPENTIVSALVYRDNIISIDVPIKIDLRVSEAPPSIKGNTAGGATKTVTLETGAKITAPIFIEEGDIVRVNTEEGTYVERVAKAK